MQDVNNLWGQAEQEWEGLDFSAIPAGEYQCVIDNAKYDYTKSETPKGHYVFSFTVLDGQFKGRKVQHRLWVESDNAEYVKKCYSFVKHLYALLKQPLPPHIPQSNDLFALVNKPLNIKVIVKKEEYKGEVQDKNEIVKVSAYANVAVTQPPTKSGVSDDDIPF